MTIADNAAQVLALLEAERCGLSTTGLVKATGKTPGSLWRAIDSLVGSGQVVRVGLLGCVYSRYTVIRHKDSALAAIDADRAATKAARNTRARGRYAERHPGGRAAAGKRTSGTKIPRRAWDENTPVDESRAIRSSDGGGRDMRHTFDPARHGEPGRHVDSAQARPWAKAVCGE